MDAILQKIKRLPTPEKLDLAQAVWDDIVQSSESVPVTDEIHDELVRRAAWHQANPDHGQTLDEIVLKLGVGL